ncbi:hypothetical protein ALP51_00680 [Pseudomonas savastanoi]|uniref:Glyoxalase protein n=1 Tax=Pseudomonas savastanoi TaxID=29438 RepID=A0A3M5JWK6_PSESS|nr:hypothetical protein ALP51_00680 [Pseudomonas savastanoi]
MSTTEQATVTFDSAIPILRMFDERKAREFYLDFLGFSVEFEHRFEADLPLYLGISRNGLHLHLSEHLRTSRRRLSGGCGVYSHSKHRAIAR